MRGTQGVQLGRRASVFISAAQVKSFKFKIVSLQRAWRGYVAKCEAQRMLVGKAWDRYWHTTHEQRRELNARLKVSLTPTHPPTHSRVCAPAPVNALRTGPEEQAIQA
jgi:hypothetical protein